MIVTEVIKKAMLAGLGAQEKARELVEELVKAGELSKSEGANLVKEWVSKTEEKSRDLDQKVKDAIAAAFEKINLPARDDVVNLEKKVQSLSERIAKLEGGNGKSSD